MKVEIPNLPHDYQNPAPHPTPPQKTAFNTMNKILLLATSAAVLGYAVGRIVTDAKAHPVTTREAELVGYLETIQEKIGPKNTLAIFQNLAATYEPAKP